MVSDVIFAFSNGIKRSSPVSQFGFETDKNITREETAKSCAHYDDAQIRSFLWEDMLDILSFDDAGDELPARNVGRFYGYLDVIRQRLTENYNAHASLQSFAETMKTIPDIHLEDTPYLARALKARWAPQENPWLRIGKPQP
jgi:hypothetical protein